MQVNNIKEIYNEIAEDFSSTRYKMWPCVKTFLFKIDSNKLILDIGCGNGKNMTSNHKFKGLDISEKLVDICKKKGLDAIQGSMTDIPYEDIMFDNFIAVASYHHLDNDIDRQKTLNEMYRILVKDGIGLIVVWSLEQDLDSRFNFTKRDEIVSWKATHNRYYHIYGKGDLVEEINRLEPRFTIIYEGWEKGNWIIYIQK
jgi:SAM-dependent methyltransferase